MGPPTSALCFLERSSALPKASHSLVSVVIRPTNVALSLVGGNPDAGGEDSPARSLPLDVPRGDKNGKEKGKAIATGKTFSR